MPPGDCYIEVAPPSGFIVTALDAGSDDALDSDFAPELLSTAPFTLSDSDFDFACGFVVAP